MKYMGSKNRYAKYLLPIILKNRKENQWYVEPVVGGANLIDKVTGNRLAADINPYLIALYKKAQEGWMPKTDYTEQEYNHMKNNKHLYPKYLVGYFGFALSYGGRFFEGWCRDKAGKRNYVKEAYNNAVKQFPYLKNIIFKCAHYSTFKGQDCIIYCDPPYYNSTKYNTDFDHNAFWQWVRDISIHNRVYISEYTAPNDFKCIWEKEVNSSLEKDTGGKKNIERLFVFNP